MSEVVGTRSAHPAPAGPRSSSLQGVLDAVRAVDPTAWWHRPGPDADDPSALRVDGLALSSARVTPGTLFAALPGASRHGADFVADAAARGAAAVLSDRADPTLPTVVVRDPRAVLGHLASWWHGHPSAGLAVHGVTGTNGKTSTARLLAGGLASAGRTVSWSTTQERATPRGVMAADRTTPEAPDLQAFLATARAEGSSDAVVEVSSHGLALHRVTGTRFRTAVFTNLSPDHLDLHADVDDYFEAKASLFTTDRCDVAIVVVDDEHGRRLARRTPCPVVTVSGTGRPADWRVEQVAAGLDGTTFVLRGPDGVARHGRLRLLGAHQAVNAAAAVAALAADGVDPDDALRGAVDTVVPGRLERVDVGQPFPAFVDFAHNEGGHARLLPWLRSLASGRVVVVAGITGGRDEGKRRRLGAGIARAADLLVVTDESSHSEDPHVLRAALARGARDAGGAVVVDEPDRAAAFAIAAAAAGPGDVLVVVGRGTDPILVTGDSAAAFDDRVELHRALSAVARRTV